MKTLFKALTKVEKSFKWVTGLPVYDVAKQKKITGLDTGIEFFQILPETLCQATGKLDKKGQDVFEKDRVKFVHNISGKKIEETLTVYFNEESSQFVVGKSGCLLPLHMYKVGESEVTDNELNDNYFKDDKKDKKRGKK